MNWWLHNYQERVFTVAIVAIYALLGLSYAGVFPAATEFLATIDYYLRIYVCLFLLWRFRPFRDKYIFTELDRKIAFSAGLLILTTSALNRYVESIKQVFARPSQPSQPLQPS